ncbi:hypothetical protein GGR55DRAFT_145462 [Xylaria sp. FL0064]|nr:hypothetical protein GGR55DRAFT_145462 [Xylaria sp. FL0064]
MSASPHSQVVLRESLYPRYDDRDFILYPLQGSRGSFSDYRTLDVNASLHESQVHRERRYRPSHAPGYSYSRSQRNETALYGDSATPRPSSSLELERLEPKRQRGGKSKTQDESIQVQRSWERPTPPRSSPPESLGSTKQLISQRRREKTVRFGDKVYLEAASPERFPGTVGHRRDSPRRQSEDYPTRGASGNGAIAGELHHCGGYNNPLPKRLHAGERQRGHLPPAPMIPRLPTPDFESKSHYGLSLGKYDFCRCCGSDGRDEEDDMRWRKGKAKMEKQVDNARAYISRMTMGERLIADA